jgi:hypothetical protein
VKIAIAEGRGQRAGGRRKILTNSFSAISAFGFQLSGFIFT